jgi:glycosyltransferase involved in cell wall biosynthesis
VQAAEGCPLRVALDGTPMLGPRTGIGEVVTGLLSRLAADASIECSAYALTWRGRDVLAPALPAGVRAATRPIPARVVRAGWLHGSLPRIETWTGPVDVVHATNYVPPPARAPVVVSVYDLGFVRYPEMVTADALQYPTLLRRGFARGAVAHATSDFVAAEIRAEFGLPEERVARVYPGIPPITGGDPTAGRRAAGVERYVLALGTVEPRKNLPILVEAFDAVAAAEPDVALVVAGQDGWGTEAFTAACDRATHRARIHRLGYVDDRTRADLLAGAALLAYPSRYEGFGFPPLEAMAAGVPVVASTGGAVPEVAGDAALLVDPEDADGLAASILGALDDDDTRAALVTRGREQVARFTWDAALAGMVGLYRDVAGRAA